MEQAETIENFQKLAYNIKKEVHEAQGTQRMELETNVATLNSELQAKTHQLEIAFEALAGHAVTAHDKEAKVERCLTELVGQRPAEGQAIQQAFEAQSKEISQVREIVQRFEAQGSGGHGAAPAAFAAGIPFTREMDKSMNDIFHKMKLFDDMANRVNVIGQATEALNFSHTQLSVRVESLETAAVQAYTCGLAGGAQAVSWQHSGAGCCGEGGADGQAGAATGTASPWGKGGASAGLSGPFQPPPGFPGGAAGAPGGSRDGDPLGAMRAVIGGNNLCHCVHVKELQEKVAALERQPGHADRRSQAFICCYLVW